MASRVDQANQFLKDNNLKGTVTCSNGVIKITIQNSKYDTDTFYLPETGEINSQYSSLPGAGGSENDWKLDSQIMDGSISISGTIITVDDDSAVGKSSSTLEMGTKIAEYFGGKIRNLTTSEFSRSGGEGLISTNEYAKNHPGVNISTTVLDGANLSKLDLQTLVEKKIPVIYIDGTGCSGSEKVLQKYEGLNLYYFVPKKGHNSHAAVNADYQNNNMYGYFLGLNGIDLSQYDIYKGSVSDENLMTQEEFEKESGFQIYYRDTTLATGLTNGEYNKGDGSFAADLYQIYDSMDQLKKTITGYSPTNATATVSESNSGVATELVTIQNNFLGIGQGISSNISKEADLIQDMANLIYQMDEDLSHKASELSDLENTRIANTIDAAMSTILDDTVTYTESYLTSNLTTGKVGSINQDELFDLITAAKTNLEADKNNAAITQGQIKDFNEILNGSSFQGTAWDKVSKKLSAYDELLQKRIESSEKLSEAYQTAYDKITDYMNESEFCDGYITLDDSLIPKVRETISELTQKIANANAELTATITVPDPVTGEMITEYKYNYDYRQDLKKQIETAELEKAEAEEYLAKLEGFAPFLNTVLKELNATLQEIYGDYGKKAKEVFPGKSTEYTKVDDTDTDKSDPTKTKTTTRNGGGGGGGSNSQDYTSNSSTEYTGETVVDSDSLLDGTTLETTEETTEEVVATPVNYDNNAYNYSDTNNVETLEEDIDLEELDDDSYLYDDFYEDDDTIIEEDGLIDISNNDESTITNNFTTETTGTTKKSSGLKTAGKVIGLGAALGAAGYGGYTIYKKHKENDDTE